eukprot:CAMPEP_0185256982 /NCGR_PEP_ID=MMETSP1359-20130426/6046_1 /TAXON_ID=552665 /ORGANISM="Bigelowiella longifila, Strain CCMP242" /LENGTH=330 /DNA_ID=CAMNT_0027841831 /DNA_START=350 /DNA_END=1342 /DNA_ORIENTATION=+
MDEEKMLPEEIRNEGLFISQRIILHNACQAFDRIDLDRNGHISCDEIEKLCHLLTMKLSRNEAAKMEHETMEHMRVMVDKTGQISKAKFVIWWLEHVDVFGTPFDPSTQKPPSIFWRATAGLLDLVQSFTPFVALCFMGVPADQMSFLFCGSLVLFFLRDTWTAEGRSMGKKICGLEIVQLEKTKVKDENGKSEEAYRATSIPATRTLGMWRNIYGLIGFAPWIGGMVSTMDCTLLLFSKHRRSIGDHMARTMVVPEGPRLKKRLKEMHGRELYLSLRSNLVSETKSERGQTLRKYPHVSHLLFAAMLGILAGYGSIDENEGKMVDDSRK